MKKKELPKLKPYCKHYFVAYQMKPLSVMSEPIPDDEPTLRKYCNVCKGFE